MQEYKSAAYLITFAAMKFLFTCLSVFLLYLSCIPCSDSEECKVKTVVNSSIAADHQEHNHAKENCTPFCTCSCCTSLVFSHTPFKTAVTTGVTPAGKYPLIDEQVNAGPRYSIWQPPKNA